MQDLGGHQSVLKGINMRIRDQLIPMVKSGPMRKALNGPIDAASGGECVAVAIHRNHDMFAAFGCSMFYRYVDGILSANS